MTKIKSLFIIALFYIGNVEAQEKDLNMYENIKSFYKLIGFNINQCDNQKLKTIINIKDLDENLNNKDVAVYKFNSSTNDLPSNIIIVEKDSIDIYDIFAINAIISRIIAISIKYPEVSTNKKDIAWIKKILLLNLSANQNVRSESWIVEKKVGNYSYHIKYSSYKFPKE